MPFQSDKQRRYLWANEPEIAREWTDRYGARGGGIMRIPLANGSLTTIGQNTPGAAEYFPGDVFAGTRRAMTQPNLNIQLEPYDPNIPQELQFWGGQPFTAQRYDPYSNVGGNKTKDTQYDWEGNFRGSNRPDWWGKSDDPVKYNQMKDTMDRYNYPRVAEDTSDLSGMADAPRPLGFDTSYGVANEADVPQKPLTQESKAPYSIKDQLKRDFLDPFKKAVETVLPGGEPGYVKGGLYRNIGSTIGKPVLGITSLLMNMVDKFDQLPEADQMYISQQMGGAGQMGEGIYRDPQSGLLKDKGGKNVRSLRGNYAEAVYKEANRYDTALEKTKKAHLKKYGRLDAVNKYGKTWAEMNKRNLEMSRYYNDKKIKQKKFVSNYLQSEKVQKQKVGEIVAKEEAKKIVPTWHVGPDTPSKTYSGGAMLGSGMTTGQHAAFRSMAQGGRASYFNGGLASLWRR